MTSSGTTLVCCEVVDDFALSEADKLTIWRGFSFQHRATCFQSIFCSHKCSHGVVSTHLAQLPFTSISFATDT